MSFLYVGLHYSDYISNFLILSCLLISARPNNRQLNQSPLFQTSVEIFLWSTPGGGGTPIHYLYGYVPPNGVVILKLLIWNGVSISEAFSRTGYKKLAHF